MAQSRTNFVGALVTLVVFCLYTVPWKKTLLLALLVPIALLAVASLRSEFSGQLSSALLLDDPYRGINSGLSGRSDHIPIALDLITASPMFGHGFRIEEEYLPEKLLSVGAIHNGYLGALVEVGFVGAVPLFLVIGAGIYRLHRQARRSRLHTIGIALVVGYITIAMAQPYLVNLANPAGVLVWAFLLGSFSRRTPAVVQRRPLRFT